MTSVAPLRKRTLQPPTDKSYFLFGPRGTGKSTWVRARYPGAVYIDLLDSAAYTDLLARPERLELLIPSAYDGWVIIDEVQKVPALLDEVHRLIEKRRLRFVLTGSSARKLRRRGVNLLAGRALTLEMHPFTAAELGPTFVLERALEHGMLPAVWAERDPAAFLESYVHTYLREEVQQEGLVRNLAAFARFVEAASFSQAGVLNVSAVARDCGAERKTVEGYFDILEDLLLAVRVQPFARRAKRRIVSHPKFYLFDAGVYRAVRPSGPLDPMAEIAGPAMETLLLQHLRASNAARRLGYEIHYWRDALGHEVDFVLYGRRGLHAFEVQRSARIRDEDLVSLGLFLSDYPMATATVVYAGTRPGRRGNIEILPLATFLAEIDERLG
jgi:predicted AAA+ superfamily ATPase